VTSETGKFDITLKVEGTLVKDGYIIDYYNAYFQECPVSPCSTLSKE